MKHSPIYGQVFGFGFVCKPQYLFALKDSKCSYGDITPHDSPKEIKQVIEWLIETETPHKGKQAVKWCKKHNPVILMYNAATNIEKVASYNDGYMWEQSLMFDQDGKTIGRFNGRDIEVHQDEFDEADYPNPEREEE